MDINKIQLHNINLKEFLDAIDHCKGDVFLETEEGDSLNLKSKLCQIIGLSSILSNPEIGEATIRVSVDFQGYDQADPELGEDIFYPGSFLVGEVTNYDFTPLNTTIRVEDGQVIELHRAYIP